jgi:hypothetical protein
MTGPHRKQQVQIGGRSEVKTCKKLSAWFSWEIMSRQAKLLSWLRIGCCHNLGNVAIGEV